jgi:radical SAM protein with 4Fe4S-binding SPASM domain
MDVKPLTSLIIEPTNTCNLRCTFCYVTEGMNRPEGFMDLDLFKKVVDDVPDLEHLCMHNWGEPLLHKGIFDMFHYAHRAGVEHIVMNTNGTLMTSRVIQRIVDSPLSIIRFSIDGSPETFKRTRGVELEKIEKNILRLKDEIAWHQSNLQIGVVFTVEEETWEDADDYIGYWERIVDQVRLQPKLTRAPREDLCPEPFGKDYGKLVVLWDGRVIPCCVDYNAQLQLGHASTDSVLELWQGLEIKRLRQQHAEGDFPGTCADCNECDTVKTEKRFFYTQTV